MTRAPILAALALAACGDAAPPGFSTGPAITSVSASTSGSSSTGDTSSTGPADDSAGTVAVLEAPAEVDAASAAVLLDADLAILGADPAAYRAYATGVRVEYAHVPDDAWRTGRAAVLDHFLARDRLFLTDTMHAELDQRAQLGGRLRHLDLEVGELLDLLRHAGKERRRQGRPQDTQR